MTVDEYEEVLRQSACVRFGTRNVQIDLNMVPGLSVAKRPSKRLVLREIKEFHRLYEWI
jgi:polyketide biosynthesis 3-hydroxy-3-methylglutaryl-CoA synthase-like enzyme PksG